MFSLIRNLTKFYPIKCSNLTTTPGTCTFVKIFLILSGFSKCAWTGHFS